VSKYSISRRTLLSRFASVVTELLVSKYFVQHQQPQPGNPSGFPGCGLFPLFVTEHPSAVQRHAPVTASLLSKSAPSKKIQSLIAP